MTKTFPYAAPENDAVCARQIAFFAAFLLPVYKLLELPSLLAGFTKSDLLLPALLQFLSQTGVLIGVLLVAARSETSILERLQKRLGKWIVVVYVSYALYFLLAVVLPLLDLEKFVYAAFYDTSPTLFAFAAFFLLSGFVCSKGLKMTGRIADLCLFPFLLPFLALIAMSLTEADATNLLPVFEQGIQNTFRAVTYTTPHFSDVALLLPLLCSLRYKKGDGKKITLGYATGAMFVLVFLAVFYGLYSTVAAREHYAFSKIAQYFPVLSVVGRIDLLFVYMLSIVLFFYTCIPLQYTVDLTARLFKKPKKPWISALLNVAVFLFVLFGNKHYNAIYAAICRYALPAFFLFGNLLPTALLFLREKKLPQNREKENENA